MPSAKSKTAATRQKAVQDRLEAAESTVKEQAALLKRMECAVANLVKERNVGTVETHKRTHSSASVVDEGSGDENVSNYDGESEKNIWNRVKRVSNEGVISEREFLATARAYVAIMEENDATLLSEITSEVIEKGREIALENLLAITSDTKRITSGNKDGLTLWSIELFDHIQETFSLREQKVTDVRRISLNIHQLREVAVASASFGREIVIALEDHTGTFNNSNDISGLTLERRDKEGRLIFNKRLLLGSRQVTTFFAIKGDDSKAGFNNDSSSSSSSSSNRGSTSCAKVAYSDSVMAVSEKDHGTYTVMTVVHAASRGSQVGGPRSINERTQDVSMNLKYADLQGLLSWILPDVRCCTPCTFEEMKACAEDKTKVQGLLPVMSTADVVVCFKLLIILLQRLYGLHERITSKLLGVANLLVDFEMVHQGIYPNFKHNGSAYILVNKMLGNFSEAMMNRHTTHEKLEMSIENFELSMSTPWVFLELTLIEKKELHSVVNNMKRVRVSEPAVLNITTAQTVPNSVSVAGKQSRKKRKVAILQAPAATSVVATRPSFSSLCRGNCCLEGCSRGASCKFEHVKNVRDLTAAEKESMKKVIATHNAATNKPGWSLLTPDPTVVGV